MSLADKIKSVCENVKENEPMKNHTTFKVGGECDIYASVKDISEIKEIIRIAKEENIPFYIKGNGSNLLVTDNGIRGIVIEIGDLMSKITVNGDTVTAEAGAKLSRVSSTVSAEELTGFENFSGIPGNVGGAVYMNAGAYERSISDIIVSATVLTLDGKVKTYSKEEMELSYRSSIFMKNKEIIISAVFKLEKGEKTQIEEKIRDFTKRRTEKQPLNYPSAGSTFKRPQGYFAGKLISDCGLKGYKTGGAMISDKHAGFIVNTGNATAKDILDLIKYTKNTVYQKFGVMLEPEVEIIGKE